MRAFLDYIPKKILVSGSIIAASIAVFLALFFTLGQSQVNADTDRQRLTNEISQTKKNLSQAQTDRQYIVEHQEQFESLIKSDRLVPHTRRIAILELQRLATANGITALSFNFKPVATNSPTTAQAQPTGDAYRVSIEDLGLKVSAPIDGDIYRFIRDISDSFPGAAVVQSVKLNRATDITNAMLALLSQGQDAQIVQGEIDVSWRTAQAQEKAAPKARSAK